MNKAERINDLLKRRWSPRAFSDRAVADAVISRLFEAARWAPSCYNDQPWYFVIGRRGRGDAYAHLLDVLVPFNQSWAATAPIIVIGVARENFAHNNKPNSHAWYDLGQAMSGLLVQATHEGLMVHQMAGFDAAAAEQTIGVPTGHSAVVAAVLGYAGDAARLPEGVDEKDPLTRERRPLEEIVFEGKWGVAVE